MAISGVIKNYIGVKVKDSYISNKSWKDIQRPAGMNQIIYMSIKYPSKKILDDLGESLNADEILLVFNPDDTLQSLRRK
jgi:hypothetical protein